MEPYNTIFLMLDAEKTTSNDQDGAISESGDLTYKYLVIRAAISRVFIKI